jgi:hypothetical protein
MKAVLSCAVLLLLLLASSRSVAAADPAYNESFLEGFNGPFPTLGGFAGTEMSSTVSLLYQNDWDVDYLGHAAEDWSSKCIEMLYRCRLLQPLQHTLAAPARLQPCDVAELLHCAVQGH